MKLTKKLAVGGGGISHALTIKYYNPLGAALSFAYAGLKKGKKGEINDLVAKRFCCTKNHIGLPSFLSYTVPLVCDKKKRSYIKSSMMANVTLGKQFNLICAEPTLPSS